MKPFDQVVIKDHTLLRRNFKTFRLGLVSAINTKLYVLE